MKAIQWIIAVAGLAFGLPASAQAAQTDPEVIIYRFPGVLDTGNFANLGVATVFFCTNFGGVTENIRFVTRTSTGALASNLVFNLVHLGTLTTATHSTALYADAFTSLATGPVSEGTTAIAATSTNVICTATTIDAAASTPIGIALRGIRFNPVPGSQE